MENEKSNNISFKKLLDDFENYIAAFLFIGLTILLFTQVVTRYFLKSAATWTEEVSNIIFVALTYLGVSSAVKHRKHLCIDFVIEKVSFRTKRILLIISDIVFIMFCIYMLFPMSTIIKGFGGLGGASSPLLGIPKVISYGVIPISFAFTVVRLVQDIIRLMHEKEKEIGATKPTLDLNAAEAEWEQRKQLLEGGID
jgi:C4-dicarboxylate transporter DctQ subunit